MEVATVGLDLGKDVFQAHGIAADGTVVFNRSIRRRQLLKFFETLPSCLVGIEACGSAHHWARELIAIGHDVRLMPAVYVKPYVKRGKTDAVDAAAICEAVTRPTMRFVAVKSKEQQALLTMHRVRQLIVRQKTQMLNVIRGL
ncbi:IS110 family transposase, partial [Ruegeria sp. MALMAid1280]|uniref:IS110 family transposase n=1 Tax=Ruegeria sp. MALMAid1280 TaxID=3411634 RepID=UPI003B9E42A5